jgi:hypothetical protein
VTDLLDRDDVLAKGHFAERIGVSPARVSQMIAEGKIFGPALVGEGRSAKINVRVAIEQLRGSVDPSQQLGMNGKARLDLPSAPVEPAAEEAVPTPEAVLGNSVDAQYRAEKLRAIQLANERADEAAAARRGIYVASADVKREMGRIASRMLSVFEGSLGELATTLSAHFKVPQRDVLHLLKAEFRGVRDRAATQARAEAAGLPKLVEDANGGEG